MREIKFRAWADDTMYQDVFSVNPRDSRWIEVYSSRTGHSTVAIEEPYELMQYTGLKDKNGVEIYEGDIVKILYTDWPSQLDSHPELSHEEYLDSIALTRVVIWSVQGFYVSHKVDGYAESMEPGTHGYIEVIGNIYQNPELLEHPNA